jgi:hypothetical protein
MRPSKPAANRQASELTRSAPAPRRDNRIGVPELTVRSHEPARPQASLRRTARAPVFDNQTIDRKEVNGGEEARGNSFIVPPDPLPAGASDSQPESMLLPIDHEESAMLSRLLQRAIREVRYELSITATDQVRALITPRADLLSDLLHRVQAVADVSQAFKDEGV